MNNLIKDLEIIINNLSDDEKNIFEEDRTSFKLVLWGKELWFYSLSKPFGLKPLENYHEFEFTGLNQNYNSNIIDKFFNFQSYKNGCNLFKCHKDDITIIIPKFLNVWIKLKEINNKIVKMVILLSYLKSKSIKNNLDIILKENNENWKCVCDRETILEKQGKEILVTKKYIQNRSFKIKEK
ncbi:MAG: hypothetical protein ABFD07_19455 [Methanobacterium sp.]